MTRLQELLDQGIIDEVYNQLKTGKEAEVWLVSHHGEAVAAKLYKEREFRSFKNDAGYLEGRTVRNSRTQRAMNKGSKYGKAASEEAWKSAEADALFQLHALGVHVPKPVLFFDGVLLMEAIGDAEGRVAPRLIDAGITPAQAGPLYLQLRTDVIKMLAADLIHGDLSPFNVLMAKNGPVIIDFPQVVTAAKNSQSEQFFKRDLGNVYSFFVGLDPTLSRYANDAEEIWRAYVRRDLSPHFVPSGRVPQARPVQQNRGAPPNGRPNNQNRPNSPNRPNPGRPAPAGSTASASASTSVDSRRPPRDQRPPQRPAPAGTTATSVDSRRPPPRDQRPPQRTGPSAALKAAPSPGPERAAPRPSGGGRRRPRRRF